MGQPSAGQRPGDAPAPPMEQQADDNKGCGDFVIMEKMKRVAEYLTLAAVLVGLPLGCAWIGGYHDVLADVAEIAPKCENGSTTPHGFGA